MTNYKQVRKNGNRGRNIKDGGARRMPSVQPKSFWGVENFMPTRPDHWVYTWQGISCPVFEVIEAGSEITVTLKGGEIKSNFTNIPHTDIKDWLDDQILKLMRLQADVDCPPLVVAGQEIGPEIGF